MRIIDLSRNLDTNTPPFPGDNEVEICVTQSKGKQTSGEEGYLNASTICFSLHTGTHMDAPFHFFNGQPTIDQIPLESCIGPAIRLDLTNRYQQTEIDTGDLFPYQTLINQQQNILIETGWGEQWKTQKYFTDYPVLTENAAEFLLSCGVKLIGIDTPSVDKHPHLAHQVLLGRKILILENLAHLDQLPDTSFQLIALPLKITGRDGSPIRAVARIKE